MAIARSIIEFVPVSMLHPKSRDPRRTCSSTIVLDGKRYRCGRETFGPDVARGLGHHDGIHDAFVVHGDGGAVRW